MGDQIRNMEAKMIGYEIQVTGISERDGIK